jgi:predicted nucleotidyltransferase component of viral defense system
VDITIKEEIVFPLEPRRVLRAYGEYQDLPDDAEIRAYSLSEIASEKVVALLDAARNEPRDLYDIWFLTGFRHVDLRDLIHAIEKKWAFREKKPAEMREALDAKEARYKKLWEKRLAAQMAELPEYEEVFRQVRRVLREADIIGK